MKGGCMSTTDDDRDVQAYDDPPLARARTRRPRSCRASRIRSCRNTIAGRALVAVIAIMTFLASLTTGAVMLVHSAAGDWQSEVAREVTIQVRVAPGRDIEADVPRAAELARKLPGVADVRPYSKEESARLLEPWLGAGLELDDLPVPRIVVVRLEADAGARSRRIAQTLAERGAGCEPRRSSQLRRPHARHGECGGDRRASWCWPDAAGDRPVGDVRDPRRDGGQPHR